MVKFALLFFIPTLMILFGVIFFRFPPKKNALYGYRTPRSVKSQESWEYAHRVSGMYWLMTGAILLIISNIIFWLTLHQAEPNIFSTINGIVDIVAMVVVIPYTEIKLAKKFK